MNFDRNYLQPFGKPLPFSGGHQVSVSMPKWADVENYEKGVPEALAAMQCGYPRFFLHPSYEALRQYFSSRTQAGEAVWVFPSETVAQSCVQYVGKGRVQNTNHKVALAFVPQTQETKAKEFWQHTGLIVSSRWAEGILSGREDNDPKVFAELQKMIAGFHGIDAGDVYLSPTGMSAIFSAYQAVICKRGKKTIQLGFPYTDTLKIQEKFGNGIYVPYESPEDIGCVESLVKQGDIAAVFCEIPGNPLLRTIDLRRLRHTLEPYGVPLVIDDTLGPPCNVDVKPYADIAVTSLTKFFSGVGDVMGGALILNRQSAHYQNFKGHMEQSETLLYGADARVLLDNAQGFDTRMQEINRNAALLVAHLRKNPKVERIYYPEGDAYEDIRLPGGGYGGLFSMDLTDPKCAPQVYDALAIAKGPSLGTDFSLASPYTLLAHYNELPWAAENGVRPDLIRVSVGRENIRYTTRRFDAALASMQP